MKFLYTNNLAKLLKKSTSKKPVIIDQNDPELKAFFSYALTVPEGYNNCKKSVLDIFYENIKKHRTDSLEYSVEDENFRMFIETGKKIIGKSNYKFEIKEDSEIIAKGFNLIQKYMNILELTKKNLSKKLEQPSSNAEILNKKGDLIEFMDNIGNNLLVHIPQKYLVPGKEGRRL